MPVPRRRDAEQDYQGFPDVSRRNFFQAALEVPMLVRSLCLPAGTRILEIGCGRGVALPPLAMLLRPRRMVGVDLDSELLAVAGERLRRERVAAELYRADARALPVAPGEFDIVLDFGTCYHISDPARALREIVRVLRPGGLFVSETVSSQLLSHPVRTRGRRLPWAAVPELRLDRQAILWKSRRKTDSGATSPVTPRCSTYNPPPPRLPVGVSDLSGRSPQG